MQQHLPACAHMKALSGRACSAPGGTACCEGAAAALSLRGHKSFVGYAAGGGVGGVAERVARRLAALQLDVEPSIVGASAGVLHANPADFLQLFRTEAVGPLHVQQGRSTQHRCAAVSGFHVRP